MRELGLVEEVKEFGCFEFESDSPFLHALAMSNFKEVVWLMLVGGRKKSNIAFSQTPVYTTTQRGGHKMYYLGFSYTLGSTSNKGRTTWRCANRKCCKGKLVQDGNEFSERESHSLRCAAISR